MASPYWVFHDGIGGILRPLANPEPLKSLPMCSFENLPMEMDAFQNSLESTSNTNPWTPWRPRLEAFGWVFRVFSNDFEEASVSICSFFSKLHVGRFFGVLGFAEGHRVPWHSATATLRLQMVQ